MDVTGAPAAAMTSGADADCECCRHTWSSHDALGKRFCTATQTHALTRSCICAAA